MLDSGQGLIMSLKSDLESELDHLMRDCKEDGKHIFDYIDYKIQIRERRKHDKGGIDK